MKTTRYRHGTDKAVNWMMIAVTGAIAVLFVMMVLLLAQRSKLVLSENRAGDLFLSSAWDPEKGQYGFLPAIVGTFVVTALSMLIAVPVSLLSAVYISEYAPPKVKTAVQSFVDVLAGTPSVVYGLCALLVIVPAVRDFIGPLFGIQTTGMCILTASIVLAVMVFPIIISITVEALDALPLGLREQFLSLGATKWQLIEIVLMRAAGPGIISGIILGFGRAMGETMAVAMVIGSKNVITLSLLSPGQTLPSLIVGSFGEMMSVPMQQSALLFISLVLFIIIILFNILTGYIKNRLKTRWRFE